MPTITVDGRKIEAAPGSTIIRAALDNGIEIPFYCYHPGLAIVGQCRMCQVEVEKTPRLLVACSTPVAEGMVVHVNSPKVVKARKAVLEFYLLNHPLDCPICDRGGECPLQDYTLRFGPGESRTVEPKVKRVKALPLGPHVMFDAERCILCTRCVRFARDVAGTGELGVFARGDRAEINLFPGKALENAYSGNVIDICPVGALTSRGYRFQSRPWDLVKKIESVCPLCSQGCNIFVDVRVMPSGGDRVLRLRPRTNLAVNTYWMCDEGRFTIGYLHDPDRLTAPRWRREGGLAPASWDAVIAGIASELGRIRREAGPGAIGVIASSRLTNEELFLIRTLFAGLLGVPHLDHRVRPAQAEGGDGPEDHLLRRLDKTANSHGARDLALRPAAGGLDVDGMLAAAGAGTLRALFVLEEDLAALRPGAAEGLGNVELLVVSSLIANATTAVARAVLPAATFVEKEGTFTNSQGRIQRVNRVLTAPDGVRPLGAVLDALATALGERLGRIDPEGVWDEMAAAVPAYRGIRYRDIGPHGLLPAAGQGRPG